MKKLTISTGNKKLASDNSVKWLIWNQPAVVTCPYRTAACEKSCYALKAERVYPNVLPSRQRNFSDSLSDSFVSDMIENIDSIISRKSYRGKKVIFRIHESGDFYNLEYTKKWIEIIKHFPEIEFWAYTKSLAYIIDCGYGTENFPENLKVRASVWADTKPEQLELIEKYNFPVYTADTAENIEKKKDVFKCDCINCSACLACGNCNIKKVACVIH